MKHQQTTPELACGKAVQFCNDARLSYQLVQMFIYIQVANKTNKNRSKHKKEYTTIDFTCSCNILQLILFEL